MPAGPRGLERAGHAAAVDGIAGVHRRREMQPGERQRFGQLGLPLGPGPAATAVDLQHHVAGEILL